MSERAALPIFVAAERYGTYRWLEHRLFEVTGAFAPRASTPGAVAHLAEASLLHGLCADLWRDRLPVLAGVDAEELTKPAGTAEELMADLVAAGAKPDPSEATAAVLASLYEVISPRLLATYREHLERAAPVADAPAMRVLRIAMAEQAILADQGLGILEGLARDGAATDSVTWAERRQGSKEVILPWPELSDAR